MDIIIFFMVFDWLFGCWYDWISCMDLVFVVYYVFQFLVVDNINVNVVYEFFVCDVGIYGFVFVVVVVSFYQLMFKVVGCYVFFVEFEWC